MKFVSPSVWLVARTEELQRIKKKILENGRKRALKGPKIKISKNKKLRFFLMSQGVLCQKIRFLGQKLWPLAGEQTHTQTHRGFNYWVPYQGFSISSFCLWYERSNIHKGTQVIMYDQVQNIHAYEDKHNAELRGTALCIISLFTIRTITQSKIDIFFPHFVFRCKMAI